ncbi:MAG: low molecular weight phosphotyrosine protein phosphatase [Bacteroides sp.]|nr:low molecular weight phosphotyrosine protein phosphatase [Bacteroides sp.]
MKPQTEAALTRVKDKIAREGHAAILFVCLGNICRSPAAEEVMRQELKHRGLDSIITLDSGGMYAGHRGELPDQRMRIHARRRGYELTHRSRPVKYSDFEDFDLIIGMDDSNISSLRGFARTEEEDAKIVRMTDFSRAYSHFDHVPDPYYEGAEGFEIVLDLLEDACRSLADRLAD